MKGARMTQSEVASTQQNLGETAAAPEPAAVPGASLSLPVIADPGPIGLAAFAMTTFMLSVFNTNMLSETLASGVLGLALFYGGGVQLLAGMWEFRKGNTFGALAFSSFGAFWLAYWYYVDHVAATLPPAEVHKVTGVFLLSWAIFTAYMTIASLRTTGAIAAVFVALTITFVLLCIGAFATGSMSADWTKAGGYAGLVTAALAWYASFAGVTNATYKRTVLPIWPLS
jgi:succinate-acetate transporter protein